MITDNTMAAFSASAAAVSSRLDYANSVLRGCPQENLPRLQRVQNSLARMVVQQQRFCIYPAAWSYQELAQYSLNPFTYLVTYLLAPTVTKPRGKPNSWLTHHGQSHFANCKFNNEHLDYSDYPVLDLRLIAFSVLVSIDTVFFTLTWCFWCMDLSSVCRLYY